MLLTLPERHAQLLLNSGLVNTDLPNKGLVNQILPFPLQAPRLEAHLYWHESVENDPANRWLREEIERVLAPELRMPAAQRKGANGRRRDRINGTKLEIGQSAAKMRRTNGRAAIQE